MRYCVDENRGRLFTCSVKAGCRLVLLHMVDTVHDRKDFTGAYDVSPGSSMEDLGTVGKQEQNAQCDIKKQLRKSSHTCSVAD